jgi:tellurite resistance protein
MSASRTIAFIALCAATVAASVSIAPAANAANTSWQRCMDNVRSSGRIAVDDDLGITEYDAAVGRCSHLWRGGR